MRGVVLIAAGAALSSVLGFAAGAQDVDVTALQLKACGLIKDDAARVRCYDRATGRQESAPTLMPVAPSSGGALVAIPPAPPVAGPPAPIAVPPPPTAGVPSPATPLVPQAPPAVALEPPGTAAAPAAPAASDVAPPPAATAKTEDAGWFGMRSVMQAITGPASSDDDRPWQVKADKADLQEATRLLATLQSPDEKALLVLQCLNARTEAHVTIPRFLGWDSMHVQYRINGGPPTEGLWGAAADGRGAVAPDAVEFVNSLPDGGLLTLRVTDYQGQRYDLRFSLGTISGLRSQLATVCRWPSAAVAETPADEAASPNPREAKKRPAKPAAAGPLKLH